VVRAVGVKLGVLYRSGCKLGAPAQFMDQALILPRE
jgi:hypothetical protein